ncbi:MAG: sigma-54-dependent transcriptional regulator [Candidatus Muiribacteriota bacterium]
MKILVADDDFSIRKAIEYDFKERGGLEPFFAEDGKKAQQIFDLYEPSLVVLDIKMPKLDGMQLLKYILKKAPETRVLMISAHGTIEMAVDAMKIGAEDFIVKPFGLEELYTKIKKLSFDLKQNIVSTKSAEKEDFIGTSPAFMETKKMLDKVSKVNSVVLISGNSGTGKEMAARYIHKNSDRKDKPFIAVNCATLSKELMASELFGHVKGSFTGAVDNKEGKFKSAHKGTVFLDEIGEIDLESQSKLLRVLQEGEVETIGKNIPQKVDVRVIAATNRSLEKMVKNREFRQDLYYRLNVINIHMPDLKDRKEDIKLLAEKFSKEIARKTKKDFLKITEEAFLILKQVEWPGNIRELKNAIERAIVFGEKNFLDEDDFSFLKKDFKKESNGDVLEKNEKETILKFLKESKNKTELAKKLGLKRTTLLYKLKKYDIEL